MADDPMDAFDRFADSIRSTEDELEAADALRKDQAEKRAKPKPADPPAPVDPPEAK
jgi:hypothetical protein